MFDRAYAHSPQTLPSHASMLSGRLPFEHGVRDNLGFEVKAGERLLPAMLKPAGYRSGGFVSAYVMRTETGIGQGFDAFDDRLPAASATTSIGQLQRDGSLTLEAAARWLAGQPDQRFFLFFHIYEPHRPYEPPERHKADDPYDGEVAYSSEVVGRLIDQLRERGWYDPATIVVVSDHGEGFGEHGEHGHGLFLYNETTRVPFIVKLPGGRGGGRRIDVPVQHIDLVPTLLDLAGLPPLTDTQGRSLRPLLENGGSAVQRAGIYAEALYSRYHFGWSELHSLTDDRYRYIKAPREELYDLDQDTAESRNLAGDRAQTRTAMRGALDRLMSGSRIDSPTEVTSDQRQRLQALGYVSAGPAVSPDVPGERLPDPKDKVRILDAYKRASDLAGERRFVEALPLYEQILAEDPGMSEVWLTYARILMTVGRASDSVAAFQKAVALDPGDSGAMLALAAGFLRLGKFTDAEAHARLAVEPAPAKAHELLAKIALARGDRDGALREADLAHKFDPTLPMPAYVRGQLLYQEGKYEEALTYFRQVVEARETQTLQLTDLHYFMGDALARLGRYPEAEAELKKELALSSDHIRARGALAIVYHTTGRDAESLTTLNDLLRLSPTPAGFTTAFNLLSAFGDTARARQVFAEAQRRFGKGWRPLDADGS